MKQEGYSCGNARLLLLSLLFFTGVVNVRAGFLDNWTTNILSEQYGMRAVAFANGRYVAYGEFSDYGFVYYSTNGCDWTLATNGSGGLSFVSSLIYAGDRFFALGRFSSFGHSTNGVDWAVFGSLLQEHYGVAVSASRYVVVGASWSNDDMDIICSLNKSGTNWTAIHSTLGNGHALTDVAYGAGRFVAVGSGSNACTSTSGITSWTPLTIPSAAHPSGNTRISFLNGRFIVPHTTGTNLISAEGLNWSAVGTGVNILLGKVFFSSGVHYALGGSNLVTSVDGTNWVRYPQPIPGKSPEFPGYGYFYVDTSITMDGARLLVADWSGNFSPGGFNYFGYVYASDLLGLQMVNSAGPQIRISGLVGRTCRIDYADELTDLTTSSWQQTTSFPLSTHPYLWTDPTGTNGPKRFYRGALLP